MVSLRVSCEAALRNSFTFAISPITFTITYYTTQQSIAP
jgi:hypothetical protein